MLNFLLYFSSSVLPRVVISGIQARPQVIQVSIVHLAWQLNQRSVGVNVLVG